MAICSTRPECPSASYSMSKGPATTCPQATQLTHAPSVVTQPLKQLPAPITELGSVLYIHTTLYIAEGWHHALNDLDIPSHFPFLVNDISFSSPISNPVSV